jgi:hypothetical protein
LGAHRAVTHQTAFPQGILKRFFHYHTEFEVALGL